MSKKKLSARYNAINKLEHELPSITRKLRKISEEYENHVMINAVENSYYLLETAHGVVVLETPDAIYDLE